MWLQDPSHAAFKEKMKEFMASFDKNSDGRIEMLEVRTGPTDSPSVRDVSHAAAFDVCLCAPVGSAPAHGRKLSAVLQRVCGIQLRVHGREFHCSLVFFSDREFINSTTAPSHLTRDANST